MILFKNPFRAQYFPLISIFRDFFIIKHITDQSTRTNPKSSLSNHFRKQPKIKPNPISSFTNPISIYANHSKSILRIQRLFFLAITATDSTSKLGFKSNIITTIIKRPAPTSSQYQVLPPLKHFSTSPSAIRFTQFYLSVKQVSNLLSRIRIYLIHVFRTRVFRTRTF